jgi:hypothetical protein
LMVYERMVWKQRERERFGGLRGGRGETDRERTEFMSVLDDDDYYSEAVLRASMKSV